MTVTNLTIPNANSSGLQSGDSGIVTVDSATFQVRNNTLETSRRHMGMRFVPSATGDIPKGATINSATLTVTNSHGTVDDINAPVYGHDVDASGTFDISGEQTVFGRTRTTASVVFTVANAVIDTQQTVDVTSIVQEIVDRAGWNEAAITLLIIGQTTGTENFMFYGRTGTTPPALSVDWSVAGVTGELTATLADVSLTATGVVPVTGELTTTLEDVVLSSAGGVGGASSGELVVTLEGLALSASGTVTSTAGPAVPTIVANTPDETSFGSDTTPTLEFTGSDADTLENLQYQVQISDNLDFSGTPVMADNFGVSGGGMTIHPQPTSTLTWQGEYQVDDRPGQSFTGAGGVLDRIALRIQDDQGISGYPIGTAYVRVYAHQGTYGTSSAPLNAVPYDETPTPDWLAISDPMVINDDLPTSASWVEFTFSGANRIRLEDGTHYVLIVDWQPDVNVSTNTFAVAGDALNSGAGHDGNNYIDGISDHNNGPHATWDTYFRVYETGLLIDKTSTTDPVFVDTVTLSTNGPFRQGNTVSYTVQPADALAEGLTYYWRARVIDPYGSNTWSSWTTTRTFTVGAVVGDITPQDSLHSLGGDGGQVTQTHVFEPGDTGHTHVSSAPSITQENYLSPDESSHSHSVDVLAITQVHSVSGAESAHGLTTDSPGVTQVHVFLGDDASHTHSADVGAFTQSGDVDVYDSAHSHGSEPAQLTQVHSVVATESGHLHGSTSPLLDTNTTVVPSSTLHDQTTGSPGLTQVHVVITSGGIHTHNTDPSVVSQVHNVTAQNSTHGHLVDSSVVGTETYISPSVSGHGQEADSVLLTQAHHLAVNNTTHGVVTEDPALAIIYSFSPGDGAHGHVVETPVSEITYVFVVSDTGHVHLSASPTVVPISLSGQYMYLDAGIADVKLSATVLSDRYDHKVGLVGRASDTGNMLCAVVLVEENKLRIEKVEAGVVSILAETPVTLLSNTPYQLTLTLEGASIVATVANVSVVTTAAFNLTQTNHGVQVQPGTYVDDFRVYVKQE